MVGIFNLQLIDYEIEDLIDCIIYFKLYGKLMVKLDKKLN